MGTVLHIMSFVSVIVSVILKCSDQYDTDCWHSQQIMLEKMHNKHTDTHVLQYHQTP